MEENQKEIEQNQETSEEQETKTFTEEEVSAMIDQRVTEALESHKQKQAEAEKLKAMDDAQRKEYQLKQRIKELEERERAAALKESRMEASNILLQRGLPSEFVDYVLTDNAETMLANINKFEKAFKDAVQVAVDKRISTPSPGGRGASNSATVTKEQFSKMNLAQRSALYQSDPEIFKQLSSQ